MAVLEGILANRTWLVGGRFRVADSNVASVPGVAALAQIDLPKAPPTSLHPPS